MVLCGVFYWVLPYIHAKIVGEGGSTKPLLYAPYSREKGTVPARLLYDVSIRSLGVTQVSGHVGCRGP